MPDSSTAAWFPVLTLLIGFGTKYLADWAQDRRSSKRAHEVRMAERRDKILERRAKIERPTLLELQEATHRLARDTTEIHLHDVRSFRSTGQWQLLPDDLNEAARSDQARISMLTVRVRDDSVRGLVQQFRDCCNAVISARTEETSERAWTTMAPAFEAMQQRIGEALRKLDDMEDEAANRCASG